MTLFLGKHRILSGVLGVVFVVGISAWGMAGGPGENLTRTVVVSAAPGVLQYHSRDESQYRPLNSGDQSLTSGSRLKTGNGEANILLPGDSVLSLDANTEVELGMYENGIIVAQLSGRAAHFAEPSQGAKYAVWTSLCTVVAVGTDFRVRITDPGGRGREVAVWVEWGRVEVFAECYDLSSGQPVRDYARDLMHFVPAGSKVVVFPYVARPSDRPLGLEKNDHEVFRMGPEPGSVQGQKTPRPADDSWVRRTRNLGRLLRDLRRWHAVKMLTDAQYAQKVRDAIGLGLGEVPGRPREALGGLWMGRSGRLIIKMCISGRSISDVHIVDLWRGEDKATHEVTKMMVNFTLADGVVFSLDDLGRLDGLYTIPEGLWKGATVLISGHIGSRTGTIHVDITSETDTTVYLGFLGTLSIRLIDPNGCN